MKYKKHLATGALALSLLVGGSTIYAASPQDLGIKNIQKTYQKQNKGNSQATGLKKQNTTIGTVSALTGTGFTMNLINLKTKTASSVDVVTSSVTLYKKDGLPVTSADVLIGQKVIVAGILDKTTNILTAKTVKIITKTTMMKVKKIAKNLGKTNY